MTRDFDKNGDIIKGGGVTIVFNQETLEDATFRIKIGNIDRFVQTKSEKISMHEARTLAIELAAITEKDTWATNHNNCLEVAIPDQ